MRALVFMLALVGAGCSRTRLLELDVTRLEEGSQSAQSSGDTGAGGAGGGVSAGGAGAGETSVTTSGGGAGAPLVCDKLVLDGPPTIIPTLGSETSDNARFHVLDGAHVAVIHRPYEPGADLLRLGSTTVDWTGVWPPTVEPPVELVKEIGLSFAIDAGPAPLVGLMTSNGLAAPFAFGLADPVIGAWTSKLVLEPSADRATFVRRRGGEYFLGVGVPATGAFGPYHRLRVGWLDDGAVRGPYDAGCSTNPVLADAMATPKGWLLARTTPNDFQCDPSSPPPGAQFVSIDLIVNDSPISGAEIPFGGQSSQIALMPRPGGAWILYWSGPTTLMGILLDEFGHIAGGPVLLAAASESSFAFAVAPLDDGFAILLYDVLASGPSALYVVVKDAFGNTLALGKIDSPPKLTTRPQLAFDPQTRSVLVGYSAIGAGKQATYLARFACP